MGVLAAADKFSSTAEGDGTGHEISNLKAVVAGQPLWASCALRPAGRTLDGLFYAIGPPHDQGGPMRLRTTPGMIVIEPLGELDITRAPQVQDAVTLALTDIAVHTVVFDMAHVTFMDSSGIKVLASTRNRLQHRAGQVVVCNARPAIAKVIRLLGLDREVALFEIGVEPALTDLPIPRAG